MAIAEQISVFLENRPGRLGELCEVLADDGVNIEAIMVPSGTDYGIVHMIVDRHDAAMTTLDSRGYRTYTSRVLDLRVPDEPGELGKLAHRLAEAGIDVKYAYTAVAGDRGRLILAVSDVDGAARRMDVG